MRWCICAFTFKKSNSQQYDLGYYNAQVNFDTDTKTSFHGQ